MKNYQRINNITGWIVFLMASTVFLLTVEPTASWWDCGEYISTSYKLMVGHPPGAPLFQMIGRFFSLFAFGDTSKVALMVNISSALSSGFAVLFLFWTITMFAKKIILKSGELTESKTWAIMGSGVVGAMAFAFSDSFWFSAVEGEVYAMSAFFTAIVFWAMMKWEANVDEKHSLRWIILIFFLVGLSIGVHLLNLLTIPAMAFIYYFKKYKPTKKGIAIAGILGVAVLAFVMNFIIPQIVNLSGQFEIFFVNSFGLPFNTGTLIYFLILAAGIIFGLYITHKKQKVLANTLILAFTFILIGYSSFAMLVIRSNSNPPIDENDPENAVSLLSYLNREQYGTWPLLKGQYYNAPMVDYEDGNPVYDRDNKSGKYIIVDDRKQSEPVYDERFTTVFPRMWSNQKQSHITAYKNWGGEGGIAESIRKPNGETATEYRPTMGQNLTFFFKYQVGHMFFRYIMWNFVGRQNDIEGYGGIENGNWISGIPFIDDARLGAQEKLPSSMENAARNKFFFLPLILGLIGLFYHINRHSHDSLIIGLLFFMTGLAIIIYLNQTPYQPRERDYSYAGSTYAFAMWIGLGVLALWEWLSKYMKKIDPKYVAALVSIVCLLLVPGIMGQQGWDDHDRSGKTACRDFAENYLNSCAPNAVLITNGDNDTFPLWYAQEVEGVRTDVRVVNFMLASGDWYIKQLFRKAYNSDPLPFTIPVEKYNKGTNEYIPFYDRGIQDTIELKKVIDFVNSDSEDAKVSLQNGKRIPFIPTKQFKITVDVAAVIKSGLIPAELTTKVQSEIIWTMKKNYLLKNDLMLLDFIATSNFKRPLYFANPSSVDDFLDIDKYCHLEGIVFKFMPVLVDDYMQGMGGITYDKNCYDLLMNKAKWGNLASPHVTVDRETNRNSNIPKNNFLRLAQRLTEENKMDSAIKVLDRCQEVFPNNKITYDYYMIQFVDIYYKAKAMDKGNKMAETLANIYEENLTYYTSLKPEFSKSYDTEKQQAVAVLQRLKQVADQNKQTQLSNKIGSYFASNPSLLGN
ncbi:MAG: DUF2723 domain-containing protein [Bacteroidota bacterium]